MVLNMKAWSWMYGCSLDRSTLIVSVSKIDNQLHQLYLWGLGCVYLLFFISVNSVPSCRETDWWSHTRDLLLKFMTGHHLKFYHKINMHVYYLLINLSQINVLLYRTSRHKPIHLHITSLANTISSGIKKKNKNKWDIKRYLLLQNSCLFIRMVIGCQVWTTHDQ